MASKSRREFLRMAMQAAGSVTALGMMPSGISKALAMPAHNQYGSIEDVEHIVVLTQENRSFDHYFGALNGVRGFGDTRTVTLPNGSSVWHQPANTELGYQLPFHPSAPDLGFKFLEDLHHDWETTHQAWNGGRHDQWVAAKSKTTMAYLTRDDIPFHYQLADAFTICDAYYCSVLGPTNPNRYYLWTGWVGNDGEGGGPVIDDAENGYSWSTYPEVLQRAGISWKIYQDQGDGLDKDGLWGWTFKDPYIGNYGDNALLYFDQYDNAQPGSPLYERARRGTNAAAGDDYLADLIQDVGNDRLPQVSWIVAPEAFCEHPNWPANYGAWYIDQVLQALTSNPEVWAKTALFINYDENDGYFDHVAPPFAPTSSDQGLSTVDTSNEIFPGDDKFQRGPYGLGPRVPMIVVSPWSKGGYVCSEVFDHTSIIRFIEKRFGRDHDLSEPNISPWRRAICGDLTSAFNFSNPNDDFPTLPNTRSYEPTDKKRHDDYVPTPPAVSEVPKQESGQRPARPLPYEFKVDMNIASRPGEIGLQFVNSGSAGVNFLVYDTATDNAPRSYTIEAGKRLADSLPMRPGGTYDYTVHGPNGYLRRFAGRVSGSSIQAVPQVAELRPDKRSQFKFRLENRGGGECEFLLRNAYYPGGAAKRRVRGGQGLLLHIDLEDTHGWYDLSISVRNDPEFVRRIAGHVETGLDSMSDPALETARLKCEDEASAG